MAANEQHRLVETLYRVQAAKLGIDPGTPFWVLQPVVDVCISVMRVAGEIERWGSTLVEMLRPFVHWWQRLNRTSTLPAKHGQRCHGSRTQPRTRR